MSGDPKLGIMRNLTRETNSAIILGVTLTLGEVTSLAALTSTVTRMRESRLALVGSPLADAATKAAQVLWFIEHEPRTSLGMYGVVFLPTGGPRERATELWRRALETSGDDAQVVENAAWFFAIHDPKYGTQLVEEFCRQRPTDAEAWELLSVVQHFFATTRDDGAPDFARAALAAALRAFDHETTPARRMRLLPIMRESASKAGEGEQLRLLDLADGAYREGNSASDEHAQLQYTSVAAAFVHIAGKRHERAFVYLAKAIVFPTVPGRLHALIQELARADRPALRATLDGAAEQTAVQSDRLRSWADAL